MNYSQFSISNDHNSGRALTPAPSTPSLGGTGRSKSGVNTKKGRKSRGASIALSPDPQQAGVQWAIPLQTTVNGGDKAGSSSLNDHTGLNSAVDNASGAGQNCTGTMPAPSQSAGTAAYDDGEGDEDILPDMADDDYSAQLSWQSQSKDNLKVLMDNFSPEQYDRYESYRRNALPKQGVRRVIQQSLGQQVSTPVAQVVAGVAKVFVGEVVEKARLIQQARGDHGPLSPDHLRQAYREYQEEHGRVGAARPLRGKKLFVR